MKESKRSPSTRMKIDPNNKDVIEKLKKEYAKAAKDIKQVGERSFKKLPAEEQQKRRNKTNLMNSQSGKDARSAKRSKSLALKVVEKSVASRKEARAKRKKSEMSRTERLSKAMSKVGNGKRKKGISSTRGNTHTEYEKMEK